MAIKLPTFNNKDKANRPRLDAPPKKGDFSVEDEKPTAVFEQAEDERKLAQLIVKRYDAGVNYKTGQGLFDKWKEYDDFWNAEQWPASTPDTEDMPRPVTNIFASIIEQKIAAITYEQPSIYFDPVEGGENDPEGPPDDDAADLLSAVAKFEYDRLDMESVNDLACRDAAVLGNGILFIPWDNTITGGGKNSRYRGNVVVKVIDPADFYPGDPTNADIQSQPYIIITERLPLSEVKRQKMFNQEAVATLEADGQGKTDRPYTTQEVEQDETKYIDLLHCFWKEAVKEEDTEEEEADESATGQSMPPLPEGDAELIPGEEITAEELDLATSTELQPKQTSKPAKPTVNLHYAVAAQGKLLRHEEYLYKHGLYPFAHFQWYPKRKSFFGKPESADIISNQKERNRLIAVALLSAYTYAVPDVVYNAGSIDPADLRGGAGGRQISCNEPGGSTAGIRYLTTTGPTGNLLGMAQEMETAANNASGVTEAFAGRAPGSDLNASAIIALQEAAGVRIRGIQRRFVNCLRDVGRIWLAHWKEFYQEQRLIRIVGDGKTEGYRWFTGTDYADMEFDARVQSGSASPFNKSLYISLLDKMLEGGIIGPDEYLEFMPSDIFPKVTQILEKRRNKAEEEQQMQLMTKITLMKQAVTEVLTQAAANGVAITPEAVQMLSGLIQQIAVEQAQAEGAVQQGAPGHQPAEGMPGLPGLPDMTKPKVQGGIM
jgi:hypothetical protein